MIAVIFEVQPTDEGKPIYLDLAQSLRSELDEMEGFVSIERFESLSTPGKLLSLSIWEDEAALTRWRAHCGHQTAQGSGRQGVFFDYRLRVASIIRDYGLHNRAEAPNDRAWR
ncbi:antibiotic biosynthesis monooxygenase [Novosphingobium sp.]|uniref:antibiotic biosynthesis monooxygenase family protein n=1 Tax=Novosphingobium sp. TaxID=1874826 RepID=UPI0025F54B03|nr:antibiotic biosynthesis monooxygenase [Novosphingobium sp.]